MAHKNGRIEHMWENEDIPYDYDWVDDALNNYHEAKTAGKGLFLSSRLGTYFRNQAENARQGLIDRIEQEIEDARNGIIKDKK